MHDVRQRLRKDLGYVNRSPDGRMRDPLDDAKDGDFPGWCMSRRLL